MSIATKTPKLPTIAEVSRLLISLKRDIGDDYRIEAQDDETPTMQVTIGVNCDNGEWSYQTGDNSYSGGAYGYHYWGVGYLTRRSNCRDEARRMLDEVADQWYSCQ